jgi:hypothetical protein
VFVFIRKEMSYDNDFEDAKFRYSESLREKLGVVDRYSVTASLYDHLSNRL